MVFAAAELWATSPEDPRKIAEGSPCSRSVSGLGLGLSETVALALRRGRGDTVRQQSQGRKPRLAWELRGAAPAPALSPPPPWAAEESALRFREAMTRGRAAY